MTYFCGLKCEGPGKKTAGIIKLNILAIVGFVVLSAAYLIGMDDFVGGGYRLQEAEKQIKAERDLAKKLENKQAEQSALRSLEQVAEELDLVAVDKVKYLGEIEPSVALSGRSSQ